MALPHAGEPVAVTDIRALDACEVAAFTPAVAPLFEGAPGFLARLAAARPFGSVEALLAAARSIAHAMPRDEQLELIDAHPRLGALPATVSALSFREQGYDPETAASMVAGAGAHPATDTRGDAATDTGADAATDQALLAAELERLNAAYEAHFGFRYCVFVAGRPRRALLPGMHAALDEDPEAEVRRALDAVIDIAADRYAILGGTRDRAR